MHRRTKALSIPPKVKAEVWSRDFHRCVLCGTPYAYPDAHVISRAQGGLGIAENVVTLCRVCHDRYDNSPERPELRERLRDYLKTWYPDWDERNLIYRKWNYVEPDCIDGPPDAGP